MSSRSSRARSRITARRRRAFSICHGRGPGAVERWFEPLEERSLLAASPLGNEYQVNTTVANDQRAVAIGSHPSSTQVIVAWVSALEDGSGDGVYAQRYDRNGAAVGAPFRVSSTTGGNQTAPTVGMDSFGNFVIAWQSSTGDGSGDGIFMRRFAFDATPLTSNLLVNTATSGNQQAPSIAESGDGRFVIAWHSANRDGSGNAIVARLYTAAGAAVANDFQVNQFTAGNQQAPSAAMDETGRFGIVWQSAGQDGNGDAILFRGYDGAGVALGDEFIVNQTTAGNQNAPSIATNADGLKFTVVWQSAGQDGSGDAIVARQFDDEGDPLGGEIGVNQFTSGNQSAPSVAMTDDAGFVVVWQSAAQDGNSDAVAARQYDATGAAASDEFVVNTFVTGAQNNPAVGIEVDGDFLVAWQSPGQETGGGSSLGVFARRYSAANDAPVMRQVANQATDVGGLIAFTASAADQDLAIDELTYSLAPGAPAGASIDPATGAFTWSTAGVEPGRYFVTIEARDLAGLLDTKEVAITVFAPGERTALDDFVNAIDPAYAWDIRGRTVTELYTKYNLLVTSGTWRTTAEVNIPLWQHWVNVYVPHNLLQTEAVLFINGGSRSSVPPSDADFDLYAGLGLNLAKSIFIDVYSVPNQPLQFAGESFNRSEDSIIAYSWRKYLETGDPTWPANLPMTRAAVRVMDAVSDFLSSPAGHNFDIDSFFVAGGSKRGWTTWLASAVDPRVGAALPAVFDALNLEENFVHHYAYYNGTFSPAVQDYVNEGILDPDNFGTEPIDSLLALVDPYSYRQRLTLPKYIVSASGDEFFVPDSSQYYYNDLLGEKSMRYVPNAGHGVTENIEDLILDLFSVFLLYAVDGDLPEYSFQQLADGTIELVTDETVVEAYLWQATNPNSRDFRYAVIGPAYTSTPLEDQGGGVFRGNVPVPGQGWTAYFVEAVIEDEIGFFVTVTSSIYLKGPPTNVHPQLPDLNDVTIAEGSPLFIAAEATNPEAGQSLSYSLEPGAPAQLGIHPTNGNILGAWGDQVAGSMAVTVTVWDNGTPPLPDRETFRITVVNVAPSASLSGPATGLPGQSLLFTLSATDPSTVDQSAGFTFLIDWDGNGTFDQSVNGLSGTTVSHTFGTADTFTARLVAIDKDGGTSAASTFTVSTNQAPVDPQNQQPLSVLEGASLFLAAVGFSDPEGQALTYSWDVDNDGQFDDAFGASTSLAWIDLVALGLGDGEQAGVVRVRVDDGHGGVTISGPIPLTIENAPPTADAGGPYSIVAGLGLALAGSGSDPAGPADPLTYAWDLNGDDVFGDATGASPTLTWVELVALGIGDGRAAPYNITLRVSDGDGGETDSVATLAIENVVPTAGVAAAQIAKAGVSQGFTLSATDVEPADQAAGFTFDIDWDGDGAFDETQSGASGLLVTHVFSAAGTYTVAVRATDKDLATNEVVTHTIHVYRLDQVGGDIEWEGSEGDDTVEFHQTGPGAVEVRTLKVGGIATSLIESFTGLTGRVIGQGHRGNDVLNAGALTSIPATLEGGRHHDTITGGAADDILRGDFPGAVGDGAEGNDSIVGGAGNDLIEGDGAEGGNDTLRGGAGNDTIFGDGGDGAEGRADQLFGDDGDDRLFGNHGNDRLEGGNDNDILLGGDGGESNDTLLGDGGNDILTGHAGNDSLAGGAGLDLLFGGAGADSLRGEAGEDLLLADESLFDANVAALLAIQAEWLSGGDYPTRVAHLTGTPGGLNGSTFLLPGSTVFDDEAADSLTGGSLELDWFLYNLLQDALSDPEAGETSTDTFGS